MTQLHIDANEPDLMQTKVMEEVASRSADYSVGVEGLKTGDFVFGDVVIERKEASDLLSSITDRRLKKQSARMAVDFEHQYIIVEGNPYDVEYSNVHPNAVVGMFVSLAVKKNIHILYTDGMDETAYAVHKICATHHEDKAFETDTYKLKRSMADEEDLTVTMLTAINGISPDKAYAITDEFGDSIRTLSETDPAEFTALDGIGATLSERIHDALQ